jgi:hypothetical protein
VTVLWISSFVGILAGVAYLLTELARERYVRAWEESARMQEQRRADYFENRLAEAQGELADLKIQLAEARRRKAKRVGEAVIDFANAVLAGEPAAVDAVKDILKE